MLSENVFAPAPLLLWNNIPPPPLRYGNVFFSFKRSFYMYFTSICIYLTRVNWNFSLSFLFLPFCFTFSPFFSFTFWYFFGISWLTPPVGEEVVCFKIYSPGCVTVRESSRYAVSLFNFGEKTKFRTQSELTAWWVASWAAKSYCLLRFYSSCYIAGRTIISARSQSVRRRSS